MSDIILFLIFFVIGVIFLIGTLWKYDLEVKEHEEKNTKNTLEDNGKVI